MVGREAIFEGISVSKTELGKRLISLMSEKELSVREAATVAGVAASTLQSWRAGSPPKDFQAAKRLATRLGVTLSFLLTGEDDARSDQPASLAEVLAPDGFLYDGIVKLRIETMVPVSSSSNNKQQKK